MIQPSGYFKIWRELFSKPIWVNSTDTQKIILITLLAMANFKENQWDYNGKKFKLEPGQFVTSLPSIKKECGKTVSIQNVRTALERFENLEFLTCKSTNKFRLVTIANWANYQQEDCSPNRQSNSHLTGTSQAPNRHLTANEEGKKVKKERKKEIYIENIKEIPSEFSETGLQKALNEFIEYRKKRRKPMTDKAIDLLITRLNSMTLVESEQIEILEQSIMSDWTSIYPLKRDHVKKSMAQGFMEVANGQD